MNALTGTNGVGQWKACDGLMGWHQWWWYIYTFLAIQQTNCGVVGNYPVYIYVDHNGTNFNIINLSCWISFSTHNQWIKCHDMPIWTTNQLCKHILYNVSVVCLKSCCYRAEAHLKPRAHDIPWHPNIYSVNDASTILLPAVYLAQNGRNHQLESVKITLNVSIYTTQ